MKLSLSNNDSIIIMPIADVNDNMYALTRKEIEQLDKIASQHRRNEWSTWRRVVREELGMQTEIGYDSFGAPKIGFQNGTIKHISVSHSKLLVAVMFSHVNCGIDIESKVRNFEHVANKYLSDTEFELSRGKSSLFNAIAWCTKEAAYKFSKEHNEDLTKSIIITDCDMKKNMLNVSINGEQRQMVVFIEYEGHIICHLRETT